MSGKARARADPAGAGMSGRKTSDFLPTVDRVCRLSSVASAPCCRSSTVKPVKIAPRRLHKVQIDKVRGGCKKAAKHLARQRLAERRAAPATSSKTVAPALCGHLLEPAHVKFKGKGGVAAETGDERARKISRSLDSIRRRVAVRYSSQARGAPVSRWQAQPVDAATWTGPES